MGLKMAINATESAASVVEGRAVAKMVCRQRELWKHAFGGLGVRERMVSEIYIKEQLS